MWKFQNGNIDTISFVVLNQPLLIIIYIDENMKQTAVFVTSFIAGGTDKTHNHQTWNHLVQCSSFYRCVRKILLNTNEATSRREDLLNNTSTKQIKYVNQTLDHLDDGTFRE